MEVWICLLSVFSFHNHLLALNRSESLRSCTKAKNHSKKKKETVLSFSSLNFLIPNQIKVLFSYSIEKDDFLLQTNERISSKKSKLTFLHAVAVILGRSEYYKNNIKKRYSCFLLTGIYSWGTFDILSSLRLRQIIFLQFGTVGAKTVPLWYENMWLRSMVL